MTCRAHWSGSSVRVDRVVFFGGANCYDVRCMWPKRVQYLRKHRLLNDGAGGPAKENISHIGLLPGVWRSLFIHSPAEGCEEVAGVVLGWRRTADRHVLSKAIGPRVAVCCDVGDEVSPEADYMVLVIPVPAVFEGHSQFAGAGIAGKCGIGEGVGVVPNLHLLHLAEVVGAIKRDDLDVRLLEIVVGASRPPEPELIAGPGRADNAVAGEGIPVGPVKVFCQPILVVRRDRCRRVVRPTRNADITPEVGVRPFLQGIHGEFGIAVVSRPEDLVAGVLCEMFPPNFGTRRIRRIGELKGDGATCLNTSERRAHDLKSCGAFITAACVPAYVERVVSNRKVGKIGAGTFAEETGRQIPIGPCRAVAVLDLGRTRHSETVPGALQKPDEAVDRRRVLDDLVAAEPDGIVRKYRCRIKDLEGAAAVGRESDVPVDGDEDHPVAARTARLCAGRGRVAAASESGSCHPHRIVYIEPDGRRIPNWCGLDLGAGRRSSAGRFRIS